MKSNENREVNIYCFIDHFWDMNQEELFTPTEACFYYYLLWRANKQRWVMPIRCPTAVVCNQIGTTKQNLSKVRSELQRRGMIDFEPGYSKGKPTLYTLLSPKGYSQLPVQLTDEMTVQLPLYKEEKNKEESFHTTREEKLSLIDLKEKLVADTEWQQSVITFVESSVHLTLTSQQLQDWIHQFFQYLSAKGMKEKEEDDTRAYFCSWLKIQLTTNKRNSYATNIPSANAAANRRPVDINTSEKKNYSTSF